MISISVICSFYNMDKYYEKFLKSVENQEQFKKKIELVICLNKPSKYVIKLTNNFKKKYPNNINIITLKKLTTLGESWNLCVKRSKGKYIAIWNADDLRVENSLIDQEKNIRRKKNIKFVYGNYYIVKEHSPKSPSFYVDESKREKKELKESMILGPFFMFEKKVCKKIGFFDEQLKCALDFDFAIRLAIHFKGKHLNQNLGYYLNEGKGLSTSKNDLQKIESNVVYFRYGLFHKIIKKNFKKIINYKIFNYFFFKKKYQIEKYYKNYNADFHKNKKKNQAIFKKSLLNKLFNFLN